MTKQKRSVRKSKKRRKLCAGIFLTVLIAACVCIGLSLTVLFRISTVEAAPSGHYTSDQIVQAAGIATGTNLFRANRSSAAEQICGSLPYIEEASVSIVLPDKISISVSEADPVLQLQQDGKYYLLSQKLKILDQTDQPSDSSLPVITGAGLAAAQPGETARFEREEVPKALLSLLEQIQENKFTGVTGIDITKLYSIELHCGEKLTVKLGSSGNLKEKLQLAGYIIQNKLDASQEGTLDLSQENGQAVFRPQYGSSAVIIPPTGSSASSG